MKESGQVRNVQTKVNDEIESIGTIVVKMHKLNLHGAFS